MFRILFFLVFLFGSSLSLAQGSPKLDLALQKVQSQKLHQSQAWLNLLHYKKNLFGQYVSEADGVHFFVSSEGRKDPEKEIVATLKGFFDGQKRNLGPDQPQQSVRCQFPARWLWLSGQLGLSESDLPTQPCAEFEKFKLRAQANSATLVFASYNVNNPSSTFGHSLMRLNRTLKDGKTSSPLLDLGVNYAATPTTKNPVLYAFFGMIGIFPGNFAAMPYFYKVREYSDFDSRDLWEYNLNLSLEEMEMLVAHLWELGFTHFDYFFFTENCSYHMLSLLDVAAPRLSLVDRTHYWVIPVDTIKTVVRTEGLLKNVTFRPSLNRQLGARLEKLQDPEEMKIYRKLTEDFDLKNLPEGIPSPRKAEILDAVIDRFDAEYFSDLVAEKAEVKAQKNALLIARSRLPSSEEIHIVPGEKDQPHLSHDSGRWSLTHLRSTESVSRFEISRRFALHDFLDPLDGYPETAKIEFLNLTVNGSYDKNDLYLRQLDLMSIETIQPVTSYKIPLSWRGRFSLEKVNDERCSYCLAGTGEAGAGVTFYLAKGTSLYTMILTDLRTSPDFIKNKWTLEGGPLLGLRTLFSSRFIFHAEASKQWLLGFEDSVTKASLRLRWAPNLKWSFEVGYREELKTNEYLGSAYYYF